MCDEDREVPQNPLAMVVREYVNRRQEFLNNRKRGQPDEACKRHQSNPRS
jgi:hypothetical protein